MSTTTFPVNNSLPAKPLPRGPKRARTEPDESDEGSYGRHRHRVTRACNECRRRKDRCGGQRPTCMSCTENDRVCSYGPAKKRGLRPGYVRAIEALLGLMITTIEGSESWICGLLQGNAEQISLRPASLELQESDISVDFLLETWRKCNLAKKAGELLAPESLEMDEDGTDSTRYFDTKVVEALALSQSSRDGDTTALLTPMNTDTTPHEVTTIDSPHTLSVPTSNHSVEAVSQVSTICQQNDPAPSCTGSSLPPIPQLPTNWPHLMDVYFETTHSWLPISQKHELLRTAYTVSNNPSTSTNAPSSGEMAFLHAVLMYASHQASTIQTLPKPSLDDNYGDASPQALTRSSLFSNPVTYDLGHIRAFLVLSLLDMDRDCWDKAWISIGRAVYTAISLGFISRNSTEGQPVYNDDIKRTLSGCVTLETIIASRLSTATCLQSSDVSLESLLITDGIEEWEPWQPRILVDTRSNATRQVSNPHMPGHVISTFNRLLQVIAHLNDLVNKKKQPISDEALYGIMIACQQNLLEDPTTAADIPPQKLGIWMASVATLEIAAAERLASHGTHSRRPDGYWQSISSLVQLIETRAHFLGRCSVSPVVQSCLELLNKATARHQLQYADAAFRDEFDLLHRTIAASMGSLQAVSNRELQTDVTSITPTTNIVEPIAHAFANESTPLRADTISDISAVAMSLGTQLEMIHSTIADGNVTTTFLPQSLDVEENASFETTRSPLEEDLEDDGLFDSLATLDSTDWLANPPEFMQHLGLLDNPSKTMENIFDMEF
ncbi:hypothetical protein FPSE_06598 [Fusarium pseudograminearum CS3096]|uniref:Zn(2)-C6 fungal-type domain-containing protein n=1 Tax=Fusarium pseudograminearum (strain CS3096) TaxID=1028729 RepID=K3VGF8_FUSPC|nr:hypothetical protein FPSE_06598 [Fusarium pseudograminearum CS3096]EKJ73174.1 hypothetical protein FPSE_06598 [Fusarium pseudograminearum CS3096]